MQQEQESYDSLKQKWPTISSQSREWCDEVARSGGTGSYMILAGCIEQETESQRQNDTTEFKF